MPGSNKNSSCAFVFSIEKVFVRNVPQMPKYQHISSSNVILKHWKHCKVFQVCSENHVKVQMQMYAADAAVAPV